FSIIDFYSRRIRRIFPALLLVLSTLLILGWFLFFPDEYTSLAKHYIAGILFFSNLAHLSEFGYFDSEAELKPLLHLWSLGVEEQFYLAWTNVMFLMAKWRLWSNRTAIAITFTSFLVAILM